MLVLAGACKKDKQTEVKKNEVSRLTIDPSELSIVEGESQSLTVKILPEDAVDKTIVWSSSEETVATVIDGEVSALKEGKTDITVKSSNGISAVCKLTVTEKIIELVDIKFEVENYDIAVGETKELKLVINPVDTNPLNLNWKSSNEEFVTVDENGVITGVAVDPNKDITSVKVTATSSNGKIAECSVSVISSSADIFMNNSYILPLNDNAITLPESKQTEMEKNISAFLKELKASMPFAANLYVVTNYSDYNDPSKKLGNGLLVFSEMASENIFIPMTVKKDSHNVVKITFEGDVVYNVEESVANQILVNEKFVQLQKAIEDTEGLTVKYEKYGDGVEIITLASMTNSDIFWHFFNEVW